MSMNNLGRILLISALGSTLILSGCCQKKKPKKSKSARSTSTLSNTKAKIDAKQNQSKTVPAKPTNQTTATVKGENVPTLGD